MDFLEKVKDGLAKVVPSKGPKSSGLSGGISSGHGMMAVEDNVSFPPDYTFSLSSHPPLRPLGTSRTVLPRSLRSPYRHQFLLRNHMLLSLLHGGAQC